MPNVFHFLNVENRAKTRNTHKHNNTGPSKLLQSTSDTKSSKNHTKCLITKKQIRSNYKNYMNGWISDQKTGNG